MLSALTGFTRANRAAATELGYMRVNAAPVYRPAERRAEAKGQPSVFLATLPKSGTIFISHSLRQTLGYDHTGTMVTPTFPKNVIWPRMLEDFSDGGMVSASHLQPDEENVALLRQAKITKGVLHIRDPRPALYSWINFAPKRASRFHGLLLGADYLNMSEADRLEHSIEHAFKFFAGWVRDWMAVLDASPDLEFLVTRHEDLAAGEEAFLRRILNYYGVSESVPLVMIEKSENAHFRKGDNKGWRDAFSPSQLRRVNEMMPAGLWSRFGWQE